MALSRLRNKRSSLGFFVIGIFLLLFVSSILPGLLFPSDILSYLPSFSLNSWSSPHNSLLADPIFQTEPWRHYAKQRLLHGQFPLWDDLNAKGVPFFANMQSAVLYPLNFFYYLLPLGTALYFISFLKIYLLGYFVFLYLTSIGISKRVSVIGGVASACSGFSMVWLFWPHTNVFILFPFILYLTERLRMKGKKDNLILYVGISIFYALAVFGGHPETLFHLFLLHVVYVFFRFWKRKKEIVPLFFSIIGGFLLAAVQLIPFLEYLFYSTAFTVRMGHISSVFLPPQAVLLSFFPFLYGAPHTLFYKAIGDVNFQESIGGYVGACVIITALMGMATQKKNKVALFWMTVIFLISAIVFKIWPFWLITTLPFFNITANHRLVGFMSIGLCVLFAFFLDSIEKTGERIVTKYGHVINTFIIAGISLSFFLWFLTSYVYHPEDKIHYFIQFLALHLIFIFLTTAVYFLLLIFLIRKKLLKTSRIFLLLIPILFQTIALFWNYVPITKQGQYYPQTGLTKKMQELPRGTYLEVGNLNLPENINLMYGLEQAENYDAIDVKEYKEAFNRTFSNKNHWKKVDSISLQSLQKLGIRYIISDFDPNLMRHSLQTSITKLSSALVPGKELSVVFKPKYTNLRQIRLLPANFNRRNTCQLIITITDTHSNKEAAKNFLNCRDIRDKMFITVSILATLALDQEYTLKVVSLNANTQNAVALWGDRNDKPYTELFYGSAKAGGFKELWKEGSVSLWEVPDSKETLVDGTYSETILSPERLKLKVHASKSNVFEIHKTFYPGWYASVDGKKTPIINTHPFMGVVLSKGAHEITIEYRPLSFFIGLVISLVTLLGIGGVLTYNSWRRKRNNKFALKTFFS